MNAPDIEAAADEAMEAVRSSPCLSTEVSRVVSLQFVELLLDHLQGLHEELAHELSKHGDSC